MFLLKEELLIGIEKYIYKYKMVFVYYLSLLFFSTLLENHYVLNLFSVLFLIVVKT